MQTLKNHLTTEQIAECADAINEGRYAQLPEYLRHHLTECDQCASEVIYVAEMSSDSDKKTDMEINRDSSEKNRFLKTPGKKILIGIAASIVILAVALLLSFPKLITPDKNEIASSHKNDDNKPLETIDKRGDTIKDHTVHNNNHRTEKNETTTENINDIDNAEPEKRELLASYEPDPELEKLYKTMQGNFRGKTIKTETPSEIIYNNNDSLRWKNKTSQPLIVEIFDNSGKEIIRDKTKQEKYKIPSLSPGLYYWKLIDKDFELLFVGKIVVYDNTN